MRQRLVGASRLHLPADLENCALGFVRWVLVCSQRLSQFVSIALLLRIANDSGTSTICLDHRLPSPQRARGVGGAPLQGDIASVAYWYQTEPHAPFPKLPEKDYLEVR
jgi:hypothetical protein